MKTSSSALLSVVSSIKGVSFVGVDMLTEVALKGGKANPMKGRVQKRVTGMKAMVCRSNEFGSPAYENAVNRRLAAEGKGEFKSQGLAAWAEVVDFPIFKHKEKGDLYMQLICMDSGKTEYLLDGQPIAKADIIGLDTDKPEGSQGGLSDEAKVIVRSPKLESITGIRIMGMDLN